MEPSKPSPSKPASSGPPPATDSGATDRQPAVTPGAAPNPVAAVGRALSWAGDAVNSWLGNQIRQSENTGSLTTQLRRNVEDRALGFLDSHLGKDSWVTQGLHSVSQFNRQADQFEAQFRGGVTQSVLEIPGAVVGLVGGGLQLASDPAARANASAVIHTLAADPGKAVSNITSAVSQELNERPAHVIGYVAGNVGQLFIGTGEAKAAMTGVSTAERLGGAAGVVADAARLSEVAPGAVHAADVIADAGRAEQAGARVFSSAEGTTRFVSPSELGARTHLDGVHLNITGDLEAGAFTAENGASITVHGNVRGASGPVEVSGVNTFHAREIDGAAHGVTIQADGAVTVERDLLGPANLHAESVGVGGDLVGGQKIYGNRASGFTVTGGPGGGVDIAAGSVDVGGNVAGRHMVVRVADNVQPNGDVVKGMVHGLDGSVTSGSAMPELVHPDVFPQGAGGVRIEGGDLNVAGRMTVYRDLLIGGGQERFDALVQHVANSTTDAAESLLRVGGDLHVPNGQTFGDMLATGSFIPGDLVEGNSYAGHLVELAGERFHAPDVETFTAALRQAGKPEEAIQQLVGFVFGS